MVMAALRVSPGRGVVVAGRHGGDYCHGQSFSIPGSLSRVCLTDVPLVSLVRAWPVLRLTTGRRRYRRLIQRRSVAMVGLMMTAVANSLVAARRCVVLLYTRPGANALGMDVQ